MNATYRPDDKFDRAIRLAQDWADDCIKAGYVTTRADSHVKMVNAIVAIEAESDRAHQAPAPVELHDDASPVDLWAEIHRLRAAVAGPDGYSSWQDAAVDERIRRVRAERQLAAPAPVEVSRLAEEARTAAHEVATRHASDQLGRLINRIGDLERLATMASTPAGIPGLGRMSDDDDGYLTLQFVNEAAAEAFMTSHEPTVDIRDMPPHRSTPASEVPAGQDALLLRFLLEHCMVEDENGALAIHWSSSREPKHHPMPERLEWIRGDLEGEAKRAGLAATPASPATEGEAVKVGTLAWLPEVIDLLARWERIADERDGAGPENGGMARALRFCGVDLRKLLNTLSSPFASDAEFGDPSRPMTDDELQDFCISLSFDQDDYTVDVIRNVERRMLGQPLFQSSVMSNAEMDTASIEAEAQKAVADDYSRIGLLEWAVTRWREDVQHRPMVNIYRPGMDKAYRCVIRHAGGDPEAIVGPTHSELVARDIEASRAQYGPGSQPLSAPTSSASTEPEGLNFDDSKPACEYVAPGPLQWEDEPKASQTESAICAAARAVSIAWSNLVIALPQDDRLEAFEWGEIRELRVALELSVDKSADLHEQSVDKNAEMHRAMPEDEPTIAECIAYLDVWSGKLEAAIDRQALERLGQHQNDEPAAGGHDLMEQLP